MKNVCVTTAIAFVLAFLLVQGAFGQRTTERNKLGQTSMKFLSVSVDPRAAAMGDAVTAVEGGSTALFYNPATMAHQEQKLHLAFGQTQWITNINYNQASLSYRPAGGRFGVFGLSVLAVEYPEMQETIRADNEQGFIDIGTFRPSALSAGIGYANAITDRFSVGGHVKLAHQNLTTTIMSAPAEGQVDRSSNEQSVLAFDFGVLYRTGFRSLNFAVTARNFSREIVYEEESVQLPLTLRIGLNMDLMDLMPNRTSMHTLRVAVDAEHPRDYPEQLKIGGEYVFMNTLSLRAGYVFPTDEQGVSLGAGFRQQIGGLGLAADYAYTDFGIFNTFSKVHRLSLQLWLR